MTGSKRVVHWTCETWCEFSEIAGSPQGSPQQPTMLAVKLKGGPAASMNWDRRAVWDQVGFSHCLHDGLVMVRDEARLRRGHNDQSRRGTQCSETTLTGESWFHISNPPWDWTQVPHDRKQTGSPLDLWDMVWIQWDCRCECSEIAGSHQGLISGYKELQFTTNYSFYQPFFCHNKDCYKGKIFQGYLASGIKILQFHMVSGESLKDICQ
jgi:hypothetical protein